MNEQEEVANAVVARGYLKGWSRKQFVARQAVKLAEELGELTQYLRLPAVMSRTLRTLGDLARKVFGDQQLWLTADVINVKAAQQELADIQVVVFCMAQALDFDVVQAALAKATSDIERGVR